MKMESNKDCENGGGSRRPSIVRRIKGLIGSALASGARNQVGDFLRDGERLLAGRQCAEVFRSKQEVDTLRDVEFQVFSQFGEDGIIDWLIHHLAIEENTFVEFGVDNYREANTRFLTMNRNWRGLVMDGSSDNITSLQGEAFYWRHDVIARPEFITCENINEILERLRFTGRIGLISVDIDGNDYWVLNSIEKLEAAILIVEVNPVWGDVHAVTTPYSPSFDRFDLHESGLAFGMSIEAAKQLGKEKGYEFVGTTGTGINAFFVRSDLFGALQPKISRFVAYPGLHRDARRAGELSFERGFERSILLREVELWDCKQGKLVRFGSLEQPFSDSWLTAMEGAGRGDEFSALWNGSESDAK